MNKKNILIFGVLIFACFAMWLMQKRKVEDVMRETEGPKLKPSELPAKSEANETLWKQASAALASGDFENASRLSYQAYSFKHELQERPDSEIKPGLKATAWLESQKQAFTSNLVVTFHQVISKAAASPEESHVFMDYYVRFHHDYPELDKIYQSRKFEVSAARVKMVDNWFRVIFSSDDADIVKPLKTVIDGAWNSKYGRTLVWGPIIEDQERAATWMIMNFDIRIDGSSYVVKGPYKQVINKQVPERITITPRLEKRNKKIVTSWDELPTIVVAETTPERIVGPETEMYSKVEEVAAQYKKKLVTQISGKLASWPKFELFPGRDPAQASLLKDGMVDHEAALVLACLVPDKLRKETAEATWTLKPPQRTELVKVAIDHNVTSLVAWATGVINVENDEARKNIWVSLQKRPSYGDFTPLLAMQTRAENDADKARIMHACKGYLFNTNILNTVTNLLLRKSFTKRAEMASLLFQECPHEILSSFTWLSTDKDDDVAEITLQLISKRDQKLGWQMMIDHFDNWPPHRKSAVLFNLHYNPNEHGPEMLRIFERAAGQDQSPDVRDRALHILMYETAGTPEGWKILDNVRKTETDPLKLQKIREALATSVNSANPGGAETYLLTAMLEGSPEERKQAAHKYFRSAGDVDAKLKAIVPALPKYVAEKGFFEALLRGLSEQGMSKLKDASAPELNTLISMALASDDKMVRYFGVTLSQKAWTKGQEQYEPMLAAFMQTETNKWLLEQASNYYKSMRRAVAAKKDK